MLKALAFLSLYFGISSSSALAQSKPLAQKPFPPNQYPKSLVEYAPKAGFSGQGAIYVKFEDRGGIRAEFGDQTPMQIHLYDDKLKKFYVFFQKLGRNQSKIEQMWLVPEGTYQLLRVAIQQKRAKKRTWSALVMQKPILVKRNQIANVGTMNVSVAPKKDAMNLEFKMEPKPFEISELIKFSNGASIANAFTGNLQKLPKYRSQLDIVEEPAAAKVDQTTMAEYQYTRRLRLVYWVNLFRDNHLKPQFEKTLRLYQNAIRDCYSAAVAENGDLRGEIMFSFLLARNSRHLNSIRAQKNDLKDQAVVGCITDELAHIAFPFETDLTGVITFNFNVKERASL